MATRTPKSATKPMGKKKTEEFLRRARKRRESAEIGEQRNRDEYLDNLKHLSGDQWPFTVEEERKKDGRPMLTINLLRKFVKQVVGDQLKNTPGIKIRPFEDGDIETARIYTGLIRHIRNTSQAKDAHDTAFKYAVAGNVGYIRVKTEYADGDTFDQDVSIGRVADPMSVLLDPDHRESNGADARYAFVFEEMEKATFKLEYPNAEVVSIAKDRQHEAYAKWYHDATVTVAEYWTREPKKKEIALVRTALDTEAVVMDLKDVPEDARILKQRTVTTYEVNQYVISGAEVLEGPIRWPTEHIPIIPVIGDELFVDGERQLSSLLTDAKDPQQLYNFWNSAGAEMLALAPRAPFLAAKKQIDGFEQYWDEANKRNLPYLPYKAIPGLPPPQRQQPIAMHPGLFAEKQGAADDIKGVMGLYGPSIGEPSNERSGLAIQARQAEGDTAVFPFINNLSKAIAHSGRIIVDLIPKIYDTERTLRILGENGKEQDIVVNQVFENELGTVLSKINPLGETGKYDVVVEVGPSYATKRQDIAASILQIVQAAPETGALLMDLMIESLDFPKAEEAARRLRRALPPGIADPDPDDPPPPPPPPPPPTPAQQVDMAESQADMAQAQADTAKAAADTEMARAKMAEADVKIAEIQAQMAELPDAVREQVEEALANIAAAAQGEQV